MTEPATAARFSCARASRERGEPMWATASCVRRWILVEQTGSWGRDAVAESGLPERIAQALKSRSREFSARVLLIRRPGRYVPERPACLVAVSGPEKPWIERLDLDAVTDLLDVDFGPLRDDAPLGGAPVREPVFLVCTNGSHDACCAEFGRPLARAVAEAHPESTWECSHFGGDRFAGNIVAMPHGCYFGRVAPVDGPALAGRFIDGRIDLPHYRGRSCYPFPVQAAEHFVRERTGLDGVEDLRLHRHGALDDRRVRASFDTTDRRRFTAVVHAAAPAAHLLTCRARNPAPPAAFQLDELREEPRGNR